jgi:hypothetical protein
MKRIWRIALTIFIISMLCVSFLPVTTPVFAATTYYVAKTGNDGNDGSSGSPWLTIQKASNTAVAGDTVYVKVGTYNENVYFSTDGSAGNLITFSTFGTDAVLVDGTGLTSGSTSAMFLVNCSYITFNGFEIANAMDSNLVYGVYVYGAHTNVTLNNLEIHNTNESGIWSYQDYTIVDGCEVYDTNHAGLQEAVSFSGVSNGEVKNSVIHDVESNKEGIDFKDGCVNGSIHDNEVYGAKIGIYLDSFSAQESGIDVYNNILHDNTETGLALSMESNENLLDIDIYNNIIYNNNCYGFEVLNYSGSITFRLINNTFYRNNETSNIYSEIFFQVLPTYVNCIVRNNIVVSNISGSYGIHDLGLGIIFDHNLSYNSGGAWHSGNITGSNAVLSDPLLVSPTTDFSVAYNSPAVNNGISTSAPSLDYIGVSRPQGSNYDIGAYEHLALEAPTNVSATDGTATDKVVITWTKSTDATGYKIYRSGTLIDTVGDVATYDDTGANPPTITVGTSSASDGTNTSYCTLGVSGEVSNNGTSYSYTVKATNADGDSASSSANTGYRGSGLLLYQWQRSDTGASYADLGGGTTDPYNDTTGTAGTTYYYRCKLSASDATDGYSSADTGYKAITETSATVTTGSVTSILTTSATVAGNITGTGTSNVTQRGVCYSTTINPTTSDSKVNEASSSFGTGAFSEHLTGLVASTLYHARVYAINSNGTSYGGDVSFTTSALTPTPTPTPTTTPNPLPTLAPYTNTSGFTDAVVGINGLIILVFMFVAVFGIILLISKGENIIIALVAAVVIIYLMVSFLPGLNTLIGGMFGLG